MITASFLPAEICGRIQPRADRTLREALKRRRTCVCVFLCLCLEKGRGRVCAGVCVAQRLYQSCWGDTWHKSLDMGRQEMTRSAALYHFPAGVLCDPLCRTNSMCPCSISCFYFFFFAPAATLLILKVSSTSVFSVWLVCIKFFLVRGKLLAVSRVLLILVSIMDDSRTKSYWVWMTNRIKTIHFSLGNKLTIDSQPSAVFWVGVI